MKYSGSSVLTKIFQLVKNQFDGLATVATTGSYNDLTDKPQIGTTSRASVSIISDGTSNIAIPITVTDITQLTVYQNGLILTPDVHYTATSTEITLVNYVANAGDIFTFVGTTEAGVTLNGSASQVLFSDTTENNSYDGCATVQDALIKASEFNSKVKSIKVNGTIISADSSGNVDISGLVKNISVNGSTITTDSSGNVAITGLVKSLSLNGTSYTPSSAGVLTLSNIMKNNTAQTMSARLVAQSNTEYTTKQVRNIIMSTAEPTSSDGADGDIWLVYEA